MITSTIDTANASLTFTHFPYAPNPLRVVLWDPPVECIGIQDSYRISGSLAWLSKDDIARLKEFLNALPA